jgi:hypothetical protein
LLFAFKMDPSGKGGFQHISCTWCLSAGCWEVLTQTLTMSVHAQGGGERFRQQDMLVSLHNHPLHTEIQFNVLVCNTKSPNGASPQHITVLRKGKVCTLLHRAASLPGTAHIVLAPPRIHCRDFSLPAHRHVSACRNTTNQQ